MSYELISLTDRTAHKARPCIWCGQRIGIGERYKDERSVFDGEFQRFGWHPECHDASHEYFASGEDEFWPHENERPPTAGAQEFASWDCALLAQGRLL